MCEVSYPADMNINRWSYLFSKYEYQDKEFVITTKMNIYLWGLVISEEMNIDVLG